MSDLIADGPKAGRIRCCIVGCGRTYKPEHADETVMCGQHYRLADERWRSLRRKVLRKGNKYGWTSGLVAQHDRVWNRIVEQANERAMGI